MDLCRERKAKAEREAREREERDSIIRENRETIRRAEVRQQLLEGLRRKVKISGVDLVSLLSGLDADGDDRVTLAEFLKAMAIMKITVSKNELMEVYRHCADNIPGKQLWSNLDLRQDQ